MIKQELTIIGDTALVDFSLINFLKSERIYLSDFYLNTYDNRTTEYYMRLIVEITGISPEAIKSKIRIREVVIARKMFMVACYRATKLTIMDIGSFVNRDHSTVIAALKSIRADYLFRDEKRRFVQGWIEELARRLKLPSSHLLREGDRSANRLLA